MGSAPGGTRRILFAALALLAGALSSPCAGAETPGPRFDQHGTLQDATLPATATHDTRLTVSGFGRYAISASSAQGTALQLVDRMGGPGPINGVAGKRDGRLDVFLDRGDYRLLTHAHEKGTGQVTLAVHPFAELNRPTPPRLVELKPVTTRLGDFQQRSYWLRIKTRRYVALEAAGRNLTDLRLWKDGSWLVDAAPQTTRVEPLPGQPLRVCRLVVRLEPGLYLLSAYGGPALPWSAAGDGHPLYLRYGIPTAAVASRERHKVSHFGVDRYRVPRKANYYRLELPQARSASLSVAHYRAEAPFSDAGRNARIDKRTNPPVAEVQVESADDGYDLITVKGDAGQPYILQHFERNWRYTFRERGEYWISTLQAGDPRDSIDVTSLLTERHRRGTEGLIDARAIRMDGVHAWQRRFNLLSNTMVFIEVARAGRYVVSGRGEGVRARYRVEPFFTRRPPGYRSPPFEDSGHAWDLGRGYYVLTVAPERKGVVNLSVAPAGAGDSAPRSVSRPGRYARVHLRGDSLYTLYLNIQPSTAVGAVVRRLPIDLAEALPVTQGAGEQVTIPVRVDSAGSVRATAVDGSALALRVDQGEWQQAAQVGPGRHTIEVRNTGEHSVSYSLALEPKRLSAAAPLPALSAATLKTLPRFPTLAAGSPRHLDLDRGQRATYRVRVDAPALYRLESQGLLATEGNLRTRTDPSLVRQGANGVGRNFLIQQYLREGDYQLSVQPKGRSRGHLGVSLARTPLLDGGSLTEGIAARATLPAGHALAYRFTIAKAGKYRLRALGLGRTYKLRLEDAAGWPLITPNAPADLTREFEPGDYRIILRPEAIGARVLTRLDAVADAPQFKGHGPHPLALDTEVKHLWREPPAGKGEAAERTPDRWDFELPAKVDATVSLGGEMHGSLARLNKGKTVEVAAVSSAKPWQGSLDAGRYRLAVTNVRHNNRAEYTVKVAVKQLTAGQRRRVEAPLDIPVAVGRERLVELSSFGDADVRAQLFDAAGRLLAANDDRSDDWDFLIARRLGPGQYRLHIEPVGQSRATTWVRMRTPKESREAELSLPAKARVTDRDLHVYPLTIPAGKTLLVVSVASKDVAGVSVESDAGRGWRPLDTAVGHRTHLAVPLAAGTGERRYRVRLWSVDRRGAPIALRAAAYAPHRTEEAIFEHGGVRFDTVPLAGGARLRIAAVELRRGGLFRVRDPSAAVGLKWSAQPDRALRPTDNGLMAAAGQTLWLAAASPHAPRRVRASRVYLGEKAGRLSLRLPAGGSTRLDVEGGGGPLLLVADSRVGRAAARLAERGSPAPSAEHGRLEPSALGIAAHTVAAALLAPRHAIAEAWNAGAPGHPLQASLRAYRFDAPRAAALAPGATQGELDAHRAYAYRLPAGEKRLRLVLPAHTAAVFSSKGRIVSTRWSGGRALHEQLDTAAGHLTLLYAGSKAARFRLTLAAHPGDAAGVSGAGRLAPGRLFERNLPTAGVLRLAVGDGRPGNAKSQGPRYTLRVRGAAKATLVDTDGRIRDGRDFADAGEGVLILRHGPGLALAWLEASGADAVGAEAGTPWAGAEAHRTKLDPPASVALDGRTEEFDIDLAKPALVHLRADAAVITRVSHAAGAREQIDAHPQGLAMDVYLPAGPARIALHPLGASQLSGVLDVDTTPVVRIGEGLGPEALLAGGGSRLFGFSVKQAGPVGIGIRASSDVVSGVVLDARGHRIGEGVVQMPTLQPGDYLLLVRVPADSPPVRVRPALAGLEPPGTGPPLEVVRKYLALAGLKPKQGDDQ
ncbi:MAG TPA: hypothetical protein VKA50_15185 [Gammaproteobacteria bacterium]|nr:hypothetical protein [Gammaproteobacteria bacterium]